MRTAVLLTAYNRPHLVQEAIASVLAQHDRDVHLIVLDDGCNDETRQAIHQALGGRAWVYARHVEGGTVVIPDSVNGLNGIWVSWWKGANRTMGERRATLPYSWTINIALNHLLTDEQCITYLCDDDVLTPNSVGDRAQALAGMPWAQVVYGRLRALLYPPDVPLRNAWCETGVAVPVTADFPIPTGRREMREGKGPLVYYADDTVDPDTGKPFVEEGFWEFGPMTYGREGATDHNQVMHRREALHDRSRFPVRCDGSVEFWGEDVAYLVGDASFFSRISHRPFYGIDKWVVTKRYHAKSWGSPDDECRE